MYVPRHLVAVRARSGFNPNVPIEREIVRNRRHQRWNAQANIPLINGKKIEQVNEVKK